MFKLKSISKESIPAAFERVDRYRKMNEPNDAASICYDILNADPGNQKALITLLLALSEQFVKRLYPAYTKAISILAQLTDDYSKKYYEGIIYERRARALIERYRFGTGKMAYGWLRKALDAYEKAIQLSPPQNEDAIMRWNACARTIMQNPELEAEPQAFDEHMLE